MADSTRSSIAIAAKPPEIMAVIADFAGYPEWTGEIKKAEVLSTGADGRAEQVRLEMDAGPIQDDQVLAYSWDNDRRVRWTLVSSTMLRSLDGSYTLAEGLDGTTQVAYELTVDLNMPLIGLLKRKVEKRIIERALSGLKQRVEEAQAGGQTETTER